MADAAEVTICYGGAKPDDLHLEARIVAIDDGVVEWLERHQRRSKNYNVRARRCCSLVWTT
jgi:hypothetical protein